jgi:hypothetical protein
MKPNTVGILFAGYAVSAAVTSLFINPSIGELMFLVPFTIFSIWFAYVAGKAIAENIQNGDYKK